ncbi:MAG: VWA domain-containing protein [Deltaproteobacteria bacterium]|nr:VWA domain-containing protein [Deltaproteobacteria bacterium]
MLEFAHPWFFLLVPVPLLVRRLSPAYREKQVSVQVPFFQSLVAFTGSSPQPGAVVRHKILFQKIALILSWGLLVTAMACPEWVGEPVTREKSARDIMIAVDISGSMGTRDFTTHDGQTISRLDGVKRVLQDFAVKRRHDRMGLIVFGTGPYLQAPFTNDHQTWLALLHETEVGMAGQKTNFGDAIGLSIRLFEKSETGNRVLIVLTDGNDTGSKVSPVEAAKIARAKNVRIYTIAVGDPVATGQEELDLDTLSRIAKITRGRFFEADNRLQLAQAHRDIMALEPEEYESIVFSPRKTLYHYFLGANVLLYTGLFGVLFAVTMIRRKRGK